MFPLGDGDLFVVIGSVYPAWTNEWWIGTITPGLGHYSRVAVKHIPGAHGVRDFGGVFYSWLGLGVSTDGSRWSLGDVKSLCRGTLFWVIVLLQIFTGMSLRGGGANCCYRSTPPKRAPTR